MAILDVVMRVLHILGAVVLIGGVGFMAVVLTPGLKLIDDQFRAALMHMIRKRFVPLIHGAVGALLISGIYNWWRNVEAYGAVRESSRGAYGMLQGLLGMKVLLAVAAIVLLLMQGAKRGHEKPGRWWGAILWLTVVVLVMGSIVRHLRLQG